MQRIKKFYTAKYDKVFKSVFCDEDNPSLLKEFLSRILNMKIDSLFFLRSELSVDTVDEKNKTVDVLVKTSNQYIHIEMNTNFTSYLHERNLIYFANVFSKKIKSGQIYDSKDDFIHIDFTFNMNNYNEDIFEYFIQTNNHIKYVNNIKIIEFNMDRIMNYWYNKDEKMINKYKNLIMLDLGKEALNIISEGDEFMEQFKEKVEELNERETFQSLMTYEEDQQMIINTLINEGIEANNLEKAKKMLKDGMKIELISKYVDLPIEEIKKLIV